MAVDMVQQQRRQQPQQSNFKQYFCRLCGRGFLCGRALGGHMRAHGMEGGSAGSVDDGEDDWVAGSKSVYALRAKSNRQLYSQPRDYEASWSSGAGEDDTSGGSLVSLPGGMEDRHPDPDVERRWGGCAVWSKGKRTRRVVVVVESPATPLDRPSSEEEHDLANCLVMLSTALKGGPPAAEAELQSASPAGKGKEEEDPPPSIARREVAGDKQKPAGKGGFECKACKRVFDSHQALGGHRASHKKVQGCFASKLKDLSGQSSAEEDHATKHRQISIPSRISKPPQHLDCDLSLSPARIRTRAHECSICHRIFSSGQALGGHKRCHWVTSSNPPADQYPEDQKRAKIIFASERLDLNLPADVGAVLEHSLLDLQLPMAGDVSSSEKKRKMSIPDSCQMSFDYEEDCRMKVAKLRDLKDIHSRGDHSSSPWLQVGIGSAAGGD